MWGVQLHPEVDDRILKEWADEDPNRYAEGVIDEVLARIAAAREEPGGRLATAGTGLRLSTLGSPHG